MTLLILFLLFSGCQAKSKFRSQIERVYDYTINHNIISATSTHIVALRKMGSVFATYETENYYGECSIDGWRNIVALYTAPCTTVGLRKDGGINVAGSLLNGENDYASIEMNYVINEINGMNNVVSIALSSGQMGRQLLVVVTREGKCLILGNNFANYEEEKKTKLKETLNKIDHVLCAGADFNCLLLYMVCSDGTLQYIWLND